MNKITIRQMKLRFDHNNKQFEKKICSILKINISDIINYEIIKKSFDARKSKDIFIVYSVEVLLKESVSISKLNNKDIMLTKEHNYSFPSNNRKILSRPIIIGSGPAGLFCALILAENGYKPIVFERGEQVEKRIEDVNNFFDKGELKLNSNIQFGEGGAGTFSDGKLNSQVKDPLFRREKVLEEFIKAGAPKEIKYLNKPHIGTDYLVDVVKNLRNKIIQLGGEVLFNHKVTSLIIKNNAVRGVIVNDCIEYNSDNVVLAIGHSARDTFFMLNKLGVQMEQKSFAIGLRIEHPQEMISKNQFGEYYNHPNLPVADYKLTYRTKKGRAVYTFCMCPGGYVVNSSSETEGIVCNGMSNFKRNSLNANSAVLVNINPEDFNSNDILAGVNFQRKWENEAYKIAGSNYNLPIQILKDFNDKKVSKSFGHYSPQIKGKYTYADLNMCLPDYVSEALKEGISAFDFKIKGFAREDAILTGIETRSSSPIRIIRNDDFQSSIKGLYPCGEGAGYAGGIMSAAIDGIKVSEMIATNS